LRDQTLRQTASEKYDSVMKVSEQKPLAISDIVIKAIQIFNFEEPLGRCQMLECSSVDRSRLPHQRKK